MNKIVSHCYDNLGHQLQNMSFGMCNICVILIMFL